MPYKSCLGRKMMWKEEEKEAGLRLFPCNNSAFRTFKEPLKELGELGLIAQRLFSCHDIVHMVSHSGYIVTLESIK